MYGFRNICLFDYLNYFLQTRKNRWFTKKRISQWFICIFWVHDCTIHFINFFYSLSYICVSDSNKREYKIRNEIFTFYTYSSNESGENFHKFIFIQSLLNSISNTSCFALYYHIIWSIYEINDRSFHLSNFGWKIEIFQIFLRDQYFLLYLYVLCCFNFDLHAFKTK